MDETVKSSSVPDKYTEESVEAEVITERDSGADSVNVGITDEDLAATAVTD